MKRENHAAKAIPAPSVLASAEPETLPLPTIERDASINCRAGGVSERIAAEYAEALKSGAVFPPVVIFSDADGKKWLADGFHRCRAFELAERTEIPIEIRHGERRDALLYAAGANASHGARRTSKDKRQSVSVLLADPEWREKSDRWIAEQCAVDHELVGRLRKQLADSASSGPRKGRDGKTRKAPKSKRKGKRGPARNVGKLISRVLSVLGSRDRWDEPALAKLKTAFDKWAGESEAVSS
jgi:hypothetical protein